MVFGPKPEVLPVLLSDSDAVESFTDYFDTNFDHFYQKLRLLENASFFGPASSKYALLRPT